MKKLEIYSPEPEWPEGVPDPSDLDEPGPAQYKYMFFPHSYPALPNFGILYLSVPRATSMIVRDLSERDRYPFSTLSDMNLATPKFEKRSAKLEAELTTKIQAHLLQAISKGRLPSVTMTASIKDFVEHGDEDPNGNRTYIFYDDLLKWLTVSGFDYGMFRSDTLGFEEYEASELALAKEVEHLIRVRRELQGYDVSELKPIREEVSSDDFVSKKESNLEDAMSQALAEIRNLRRQLDRARTLSKQRLLHTKEQNSILIVLAALLEVRGYRNSEKKLASDIRRKALHIDGGLSTNTVDKWLKAARDLISRSRGSVKKSIDV